MREQKEALERDVLEKVANALKVPVDAIKNFSDEAAVNIIANAVTNNNQAASVFYNSAFNPFDKYIEQVDQIKKLYETLLKEKDEKIALPEQMPAQKK